MGVATTQMRSAAGTDGFFGTPLAGRVFESPRPRAGLIIVHGISEHGGRYERLAQWLCDHGVSCFVYDQRGHGRSPGVRADIDRFATFTDDLDTIRHGIATAHEGLPLCVWGHSMGSIVVILTLAAEAAGIRTAITTGCPLGTYARAARWLIPTARIAERVAPRLRVGPMFGLDALTHDPDAQRAYAADPLVVRSATLRLLTEVALALRTARAAAPSINTPWLAAHGAEDRIAPAAGSRDLIARLGSPDKRLSIYAGLRHEIHNEVPPGPEHFLRELHEWVMDHGARMR